jgi:uncharacterized protein (TIGR00299 family) protein
VSTGTILYVDGSQGASGDMLLGALVDAGAQLAAIRRDLATLPVRGWSIGSRRIVRASIAGRQVRVRTRGGEPDRAWRDVRRIVERGKLAPAVRQRALDVFRRLFEAEAQVHARAFDEVHLHEAGGVDAIVDVVGVSLALDRLGVERVVVSPIATGFGSVRCAHGVYPIPAPATALLLRGVPSFGGEIEAERLTPTGAAILATIADAWGAQPAMCATRVGYGAGTRDLGDCPNMLRVTLGRAWASGPATGAREVGVVEWTVDDATPQSLAHAAERLLAAGALDVTTGPVVMKKGRSGHHVTMLVPADRIADFAARAIELTSTLGVRYRVERRLEAARRIERVRTRFGPVAVKVGRLGDRVVHGWPEYDDCARLAERHGVALWDVQEAAIAAWRAPARGRKR